MRQSGLAAYLRGQIEQRNWTQDRFAQEADLPATTLSKLLRTPNHIPELNTFVKISGALGVPLRTLLEVSGFEVEPASTFEERQARFAHLVEVAPWLAQAVDQLLQLPPSEQAAVLTYLEMLGRNQRG